MSKARRSFNRSNNSFSLSVDETVYLALVLHKSYRNCEWERMITWESKHGAVLVFSAFLVFILLNFFSKNSRETGQTTKLLEWIQKKLVFYLVSNFFIIFFSFSLFLVFVVALFNEYVLHRSSPGTLCTVYTCGFFFLILPMFRIYIFFVVRLLRKT